jgi:hypothetical protein
MKQRKHYTSPSLRCSRKKRITRKKLYKANHLCMMKLALIKAKSTTKTTTPRYQFSIVKTTYHIKNAEKVPNFAARWRAICKYFIISENKQPKRRYKIQQQNKVKRHTPILRKKEVQPNQVKSIIILIPTYKSKHKHNAKSRGKKN